MFNQNKFNLSIIIPCYRINENFQYLNELLSCLHNQKESFFIISQIILVNDSPNIDLYNFIDSNYLSNIIILNNEKNFGQAYSRNKGAELATGDFLHFIDQDDKIDEAFYFNIKKPANIIIANCFLFNTSSFVNLYKFHRIILYKSFKYLSSLKLFLIFDNIILSPGQALFNRDFFFSIKGFPVLNEFGSDDYGLMYNCAFSNVKYEFFPKANFFHRLHKAQGKRYLRMGLSKKSFFLSKSPKTLFSLICKSDFFVINILKKAVYLLFNNRLT